MKTYLKEIGLTTIILILGILLFSQCSKTKRANKETEIAETAKKKAQADYLELVMAKTKVDTFYQKGPIQYIPRKVVEKSIDTLYIKEGKVYGLYLDSIKNEDLTLHTRIIASDLDSISYDYWVREKVIINNTITAVHDTVPSPKRNHLYALGDIGLKSYSLGLQFQTKKKIGFTARYVWSQDSKGVRAGISYLLY